MKLGQGNVFTGVCDSVHRGDMYGCWGVGCVCGCWVACMVAKGDMHGCQGAYVVAGGHIWLLGGMHVKAVSLVRRGQGKELTQAAFEVFCIYL